MPMSSRWIVFATFVASLSATACVASTVPGMVDQPRRISPEDASLDELARVEPPVGRRALLVVFPKRPWSGTARTIILDRDGTFYGAVAPGEAALLEIPTDRRDLVLVSSVEVTVTPRTWFYPLEWTEIPAEPNGLILRSFGRGGHYGYPEPASQAELEAALGDAPTIRWRAARRAAGQAWIEENRARVDELLGRTKLARLR